MKDYGALKALCEQAVEESMQGRASQVRAGLIVGPHDPTGRFTYWVHRVARGGEVLATAPEQPVQFIDVRDLSEWIVDGAEAGRAGVYNATGPVEPLTMRTLLEGIRDAVGSDAEFTWVDERFLVERKVEPWSDLPLWLALESNPGYAITLTVSVERAVGDGLRFRTLEDTVRATLDQAGTTSDAGLSVERERDLLSAWLS
jgi:2'-hydroxyisoflavone reductase